MKKKNLNISGNWYLSEMPAVAWKRKDLKFGKKLRCEDEKNARK